MSDFLTEKRREIEQRLKEIQPLVKEAEQLQAALDALDGTAPKAERKATSKRRAGSAKGKAKGGSGRKRGRPGHRAEQAFELVSAQPGISIPEIATKMGIHQNYLYRVMPTLQQDGRVRKEGRGWFPA